MNFKQFMDMYDNWNGKTTVNDNNCNTNVIVSGYTLDIMERRLPLSKLNYEQLFEAEVVSFGFYDDELFVRLNVN